MPDLSPEQWRDKLIVDLVARRTTIDHFEDYFEGRHRLPFVQSKYEPAFREFLRKARANWCELVVEAVAERLEVTGFRFGDPTVPEQDRKADNEAWRIWQDNQLDADSQLAHETSLATGYSYALVWPNPAKVSKVEITVEHPCQAIVAYEEGSMRRRAAGLKLWFDSAAKQYYATLYLPDLVYKWETKPGSIKTSTPMSVKLQWQPRQGPDDSTWPLQHELGSVPLVEFRPRPRLRGGARSELDGVIDTQDRINRSIMDRLIAQNFAAFKQRWATGLQLEIDEKTGKPKMPFELGIDKLVMTENPETKFGEFSETDLKAFVSVIQDDVMALAAISKTPPHYLLAGIVNVSGDALKVAETSLVAKVKKRRRYLTESWEEVMRMASIAGGIQRGADVQTEVEWTDPEYRTEGELVDALVKMGSLGVPKEVLWRRWGASPQEVQRWKAMQAEDLLNAPSAPTPTPTAIPPLNLPPNPANAPGA